MQVSKKRIGKYIILLNQKLGQGAYSQVFRGIQQETKQEVAIKVVNKTKIQEDNYTKNAFYSQIQIMKKLKSTYILKFLDVHETKNNFYIILEIADKNNFRHMLRQAGRFDQKQTIRFLLQIVSGFGELAKNGVTHRDLKPQNILVKNDILKIGDFGFAKASQNNSFLKTIVGTPAYMAPQILKNEPYTYKCDIWSLGVITFEMIVGRIPWKFQQKTMAGFQRQVCTRKIAFPQDIQVSMNMKDFVFGCLERDQSKRFDWQQVFMHPIFDGKFSKNIQSKKSGYTKISFIVSNLRMNIHSKNINISKIIQKTGDKLNLPDFINFMKFIYRQISQQQIGLLFKYLAKQDSLVHMKDFTTFLSKYQIRLTGLQLSNQHKQMQIQEQTNSSHNLGQTFRTIQKLKDLIEKRNLDVCKWLRGLNIPKQKQIDVNVYSKLLSQINPDITAHEAQLVFKQFDTNKDGSMTFQQTFNSICKIAQIVPMDQQ